MKKSTPSESASKSPCKVHGTVRDQYQQPLSKITIQVYHKTLRNRLLLGEAVTSSAGEYTVEYSRDKTTADVIVTAIDASKKLLKESMLYPDAPALLQIDIHLGNVPYSGIAQYEQMVAAINPFSDNIRLAELTATGANNDISFIVQKTGLPPQCLETLVMANRFETFSGITASVWYGLLQAGLPDQKLVGVARLFSKGDFGSKVQMTYDALMHTPVDVIIKSLTKAATDNIIAYPILAAVDQLREKFNTLILAYAKQHPISGEPSSLFRKASIGGLKGKELDTFITARINHDGSTEGFFTKAKGFKSSKAAAKVQAVFQLSWLTGEDLLLTEKLIEQEKIQSTTDLKKLAAYDRADWQALIKDKTGRAAKLERTFAKAYPTKAFAAKLKKDKKSKLPHKEAISKFLDTNDDFDLLHGRVGKFLHESKAKDAPELAKQLRRVQRIFKMAPEYDTAHVLLNDDIHSAWQVYKMGEENFLQTYSDRLGTEKAKQVFQTASTVHANALAMAGNLASLGEAGAVQAFPDYTELLSEQLVTELPNLETLFGHANFCECTECMAVYGAPAYFTDLLHFLDQRLSALPITDGKRPSVKDLLLKRRADLGDIDLACGNTNTQIPYIDIACELMEDHIAPPIITLANSFLPKLVKGPIDATLLTEIKSQFSELTAAATVSETYSVKRLKADNTFTTLNHWMIRDSRIVLRVTQTPGAPGLECRLLHQTLQTAEAISAGPEYINASVYNNFLKTAKKPFSLPFDLFETEGGLYLEKLGVQKAALLEIFRKQMPPLNVHEQLTQSDVELAYASLRITEAERTLIFQADTANQNLYWGTIASATSVQVDIFQKLSALSYVEVIELIQLRFINPTRNTVIEHDDLSADLTKKRITNLNPAKFDAIHRFLRLWRKTTLTMQELDAIITGINASQINTGLALTLHPFLSLQQTLQLGVFELLAFFTNIDIHYEDPLYIRLFQNSTITNPVHPDLSIASVTQGNIAITDAHKAVIAAALQIPVSSKLLQVSGVLSFANLSEFFRHATLAKAIDVPVDALAELINYVHAGTFTSARQTLQFVNKYKALQSSGFSFEELKYLLSQPDNSKLAPATSQVTTDLTQLQQDLLTVRAATQPAHDANGDLLKAWLSDPAFAWDTQLVNKLVELLNTTNDADYAQKIDDNSQFLLNLRMVYHSAAVVTDLSALPATIVFPQTVASQLTFDADKKQLRLSGYINQTNLTELLGLSADATYQSAINTLYNAAQQTSNSTTNIFFTNITAVVNGLKNIPAESKAVRFEFFLNKLAPVYRTMQQRNQIAQSIGSWFGIDKKIADQLLTSVPLIYDKYTEDEFVNKIWPIDPANPLVAHLYSLYHILAKIGFATLKLHLTETDWAFLLVNGPAIGCLDFLHPQPTFSGFENLIKLLQLQQYYPAKASTGLYTIFNTIIELETPAGGGGTDSLVLPGDPEINEDIENLLQQISILTGWNIDHLHALTQSNGALNIGLPQDLKKLHIWLQLHHCMHTIDQLGVQPATIISWCKPSLTIGDTAGIKQALKSKLGGQTWMQVTKPLQDTLREQKRDALITYLLANPGTQNWHEANDLYSHFLLDVEMCSCQPTSRIVQASNAVQLFVQRSFLGLEDNILINEKADSNWLQWQWMKNFRVWQANVKVFLYPENWIEPELLPSQVKSPFLKELEEELLQNEVTATSAEDAFKNYLEKLNSVARLEVKGMHYDQPSKTLHVFARTFGGNPRIWYYRQFIDDRRWTPWTKIDLDITSDHIIPTVYNNRLYLFWAIITEKADPFMPAVRVPDVGENFNAPPPRRNWHIQLAFSEYKNGKWTPKKVSENDIAGEIVAPQLTYANKASFVFTAMDVPNFDYSKIFVPNPNPDLPPVQADTPEVFNKKAAAAIIENGKLVISCYYATANAVNFPIYNYVRSFQLDPVKGYPTALNVNYNIELYQARSQWERSGRKSAMVNMLDAESFDSLSSGNSASLPPENGIPGSGFFGKILVAEQAGGAFNNLIPLQMNLIDRADYMINIYENGNQNGLQISTQLGYILPYFYQDQRRSFFVRYAITDNGEFEFLYSDFLDAVYVYLDQGEEAYEAIINQIPEGASWFISRYFNFHHPLLDYFSRRLFAKGVDGLMERDTQLKGDFGYDPDPKKFNFREYFNPVVSGFDTIYSGENLPPVIHNGVTDPFPGYPKDDVDFSLQSGYGMYNWELFFHAPLMIAERLSQNQQFAEADRWYKYIFNPMDVSEHAAPAKYWNTKPFFFNTSAEYLKQRIENILLGINNDELSLIKDVEDWRKNPFQPHFIAQYRTVAYQKTAVMKYIGHLVRHADHLFRQHTMESVTEATQLYILAAEILGPKPQLVPSPATTPVATYYQLEQKLDAMSDAMIDIENLMPLHVIKNYTGTVPNTPGLPNLQTLYFCIPMNENMAGPGGYWDTVADRLFKIRHCLNIDGTLAPLALFAPPIDPGMLVRAAAAGLSLGSLLNDLNASLPVYRFTTMIQKATELCNEVKGLGSAMLSALEKKDGETMVLLRSNHEVKTMNAMMQVKEKFVSELVVALGKLENQKELVIIKQQYYNELIDRGISKAETTALALNTLAGGIQSVIAITNGFSATASMVPQVTAGVSGLGSPVLKATHGGAQVSESSRSVAKMFGAIATAFEKSAAVIGTFGAYQRREDEWKFQRNLASKEIELIDKELAGTAIRLEMAEQEVVNQQQLIDQAREANDVMRSKFTSTELYNWMVNKVSNTYFNSYQLAYDTAKKAERCFRYELGLDDSAHINFGYWDSLKKGLLAGEQLGYDIKKMETAYYDQNKRELELSKSISLSQLDPVALLKLKTTGECWLNLPEELFDMDYPGHYMRRIKSVSITIPCIAGPYTNVSCKLTMTNNTVRVSGIAAADAARYARKLSDGAPGDDLRFRDGVGTLNSMATSNAQNDFGMFEINFRDDRYLPFEGAGVISQWYLQLPAAIRQIDHNSISDIIIHLRYTARDGGETLRAQATESLLTKVNSMLDVRNGKGLMRIISAKHELPTEWYRFLHPANVADDQVLTINLDKSRFPLFVQDRNIKIKTVELVADATISSIDSLQILPAAATDVFDLTATGIYGNWLNATIDYSNDKQDPGAWLVKNPVANARLTDAMLKNLVVIVHYEIA